MYITQAVSYIFKLIYLVLFVTILLSWFPSINWYKEPFRSMKSFSEFFLAPFRRLIPPIGMIDISPIIAFIALSILGNFIVGILFNLGL